MASALLGAGGAYALDLLEPGPAQEPAVTAGVSADVVAGAEAAVIESARLRTDLTTALDHARAALKSPDGRAADKAARSALATVIDDAERVATALGAVTTAPSGTVAEAAAVLEASAALDDDVPAVADTLREATDAVIASGRQVRSERAAAAADPGTVTTDTTPDDITPAGTCPEPDQVWSAENGHLSSSELAQIPFAPGHYVRADVAGKLAALNDAYVEQFGVDMTINSSYRTYAEQESLYDPSSKTAAPPGCSNHGTGLAVDIGGGVQAFGSAQYDWLKANAEAYGWVHPPFAEPSGRNPEPWHWQSVLAPNSY
nr:hypothetical protein GCM10025730_15920 [Promicromonospora thailandica]